MRIRNEQGYGSRQLSSPLFVAPHHSAPGAPPPVELLESSATSITVTWEKPTVNGGTRVSGYELWMDKWSAGSRFLVYDGKADILQYRVTAVDFGPMNQVVESGRQYRFEARAINNCATSDPSLACFGPFSVARIFTVRAPRPPLPPAAPKRDARSRLINHSEASITVTWDRPLDNGGSPIAGYI